MDLKYWAGRISPEIIGKYPNIDVWARQWLSRAIIAEENQRELIVFEMPKNELVYSVITGVEMLPPDVDVMLWDVSFYKALMESK